MKIDKDALKQANEAPAPKAKAAKVLAGSGKSDKTITLCAVVKGKIVGTEEVTLKAGSHVLDTVKGIKGAYSSFVKATGQAPDGIFNVNAAGEIRRSFSTEAQAAGACLIQKKLGLELGETKFDAATRKADKAKAYAEKHQAAALAHTGVAEEIDSAEPFVAPAAATEESAE